MLISGDEDGVLALWDLRATPVQDSAMVFTHHEDYISDMVRRGGGGGA